MKDRMLYQAAALLSQEEDDESLARVELVLTGHELACGEITRRLGLQPTRTERREGDALGADGSESRGNVWAVGEEGEEVETTAQYLLARLAGKLEVWRRLVAETGATATVSIWWEPDGGQGGFDLSPGLLRALLPYGETLQVHCSRRRSCP